MHLMQEAWILISAVPCTAFVTLGMAHSIFIGLDSSFVTCRRHKYYVNDMVRIHAVQSVKRSIEMITGRSELGF